MCRAKSIDGKSMKELIIRDDQLLFFFDQVIGIMAIEIVGGVYCPLSPRDPPHRLHSLLEQTHSSFILVHHLTKTKFQDSTISINIDSILANDQVDNNEDVDQLISIEKTPNDIAYIIFTSGSTGTPKAVSS